MRDFWPFNYIIKIEIFLKIDTFLISNHLDSILNPEEVMVYGLVGFWSLELKSKGIKSEPATIRLQQPKVNPGNQSQTSFL